MTAVRASSASVQEKLTAGLTAAAVVAAFMALCCPRSRMQPPRGCRRS
jgi:hypothetical protein